LALSRSISSMLVPRLVLLFRRLGASADEAEAYCAASIAATEQAIGEMADGLGAA
jgi:hypothetical protein